MKKRFVFRVNNIVYSVVAKAVTTDAEILFVGAENAVIPSDIQALVDAQEAADATAAAIDKAEKDAIKDIIKDKNASTKDRVDAIAVYLGLDV